MAMATLDIFRSTVGAVAIGFARHALDEALERVKSRKMFGSPMINLKLKPNLGTCHLILMQVHFSFIVLPGPKTIVQTGLQVKLPWLNYLQQKRHQRVIDEAVQIFGGSGVVSGFAVEQLYREIRPLRIYEGASEVQKLIIASQTLKDN